MATVRMQPSPSLFDRLAVGLLFAFVLSEVLGGAIRFYAVRAGIPWLFYVPHVLLALVVLPMFVHYVATEGLTSTYLIVSVLFAVAAVVGTLNIGSGDQVEFGFWVFVPFLYGVVVLPSLVRCWHKLVPYVVVLWSLAVAGVLINLFHVWPWIGFEYRVGVTSVVASRLWAISGLPFGRLPGFSEASYFAASEILLLAVLLRQTLTKWRRLVWLLSGVAIALTTSKGPILIFLLLSICWIVSMDVSRPFWRRIPFAAACLDIALPFSMLLVKVDWLSSIHSTTAGVILGSFYERFQVGWPVWIRMIVQHGSVVLGRGLGGIGTAQQHFEPWLFSPADNIAVCAYATFGLGGLVLVLLYGWRASHSRVESSVDRFFLLCACVLLVEGVTTTVIDGGLVGIAFGASFRYFAQAWSPARAAIVAKRRGELLRGPRPEFT